MGRPEKFKNPISTSFRLEQEEYDEVEKIRWREHADLGEIVRRAVQDYIKIHAAGNEAFKLDDFQDPNFIAMPATMSPDEKWNEYIRKHMTKEERNELSSKAKYMLKIIDAQNWVDSKK